MPRRGPSVKSAARLRAEAATRELREAQKQRFAALGVAAQGYFEAAERRERAQATVEEEDGRAQEALRSVRALVETNRAAAELCGVSVYEVTAAMAAGAPPVPVARAQAVPATAPQPAPPVAVTGGS